MTAPAASTPPKALPKVAEVVQTDRPHAPGDSNTRQKAQEKQVKASHTQSSSKEKIANLPATHIRVLEVAKRGAHGVELKGEKPVIGNSDKSPCLVHMSLYIKGFKADSPMEC